MAHFRIKNPEWVDAETAVRKIQKGKRILLGSGCAEPQHLVKALVGNAGRFYDNEIVHLLTAGEAPYSEPRFASSFRHNAFFIGPNVRAAVRDGRADYTPIFLSEIPSLFISRQLPIHCALIQVSPPDRENRVSLGVSVDILHAGVRCADLVIAQVNKQMPETLGNSKVPLTAIDYLVPFDEPILELFPRPLSEVHLKIGRHIAQLVPDGATLQLGIGGMPDAVLRSLAAKNDLGLHTEMFSDGAAELYRRGNLSNRFKGQHEGVSITSFVLGTRTLYDLIHRNRAFEFHPTEYVNDPQVIAKNNTMISINAALQVDFTGQVCADSLGANFYSGIGGQVDFVRGSRRSPGGKSILALPSTAKNGTVSRIVPNLSEGAGVVTSRGDVQYVVTEYGAAYLYGKSIRERGLALIEIAHPDFREELLSALKKRHYVYFDQKIATRAGDDIRGIIPYSRTFKGKTVYFRPLTPADERLLQDFFYSHDPDTVYLRYGTHRKALPHETASALVTVNYARDMALAGFDSPGPDGRIVCVGRYLRAWDQSSEQAFVVDESMRSLGVGTFLCEFLVSAARRHGIKRLWAYVLPENAAMRRIYEKLGWKKEYVSDGPAFLFRWDLPENEKTPVEAGLQMSTQ